jgi:hypothetical protein
MAIWYQEDESKIAAGYAVVTAPPLLYYLGKNDTGLVRCIWRKSDNLALSNYNSFRFNAG